MENSISKIVRFHRKKSGLSQHRLAQMAGVGKTVVFDIERGKETVQLNSVMNVLKVLNIALSFQSPLMKEFERENSIHEKS